MIQLIKSEPKIDFVGKRHFALILSVMLIGIGLFSILQHRGLNYGIDFSGGTLIQIRFEQPTSAAEIKEHLASLEMEGIVVQNFAGSSGTEFLIRFPPTSEELEAFTEQVLTRLQSAYSEESIEVRRSEAVGPKISESLRKKGFWAVVLSVIGMLLYITWRFEFRFAIGAVVALIHDVLITLGALSWKEVPINLPIIAAFLTVVGYSVNDTIIVSDRIRENLRKMGEKDQVDVINRSINQTLSRTLLTSGTTLFAVLALYLFGGGVIQDFSFALLVGFTIGTYSSIFIASPILLLFKRTKKRLK